MSYWMSIEVFNGPYAASLWADAHGDTLVECAVTAGAVDWELKRTAWGVVFEVSFHNEAAWKQFAATDLVVSALRKVPEPYTGVLIYKGRSLDGGRTQPRKPKPKAGSGAMALSVPFELPFVEALPAFFSDAIVDRRLLPATMSNSVI